MIVFEPVPVQVINLSRLKKTLETRLQEKYEVPITVTEHSTTQDPALE